MRRLNAKKIVAVAAGAALLGIGLAMSGPVTWNNVPIINNAGQPVVQVVIGSGAKPSDGVAAANIAAAIGNLAYTSVPVTASVNATQAASVLKATVAGNSKYSLANQQVWLNESSAASTGSGTYSFSALIGSVLNRGVSLNTPPATKSLDGTGSYSYKAPSSTVSLTDSPMDSPYTFAGYVPTGTSVTPSYNGGGITFTTFSSGTSPRYDNIYQISNAQLPSLLANSGSNGESEYLWITGFPVFDQQSSVNNFALLDANGAYQAVFNKPINVVGTNGKVAANGLVSNPKNPSFTLLGQNWTVISAVIPTTKATTTTAVQGGSLQLAESQTPLTTLYIGQNLTSGTFMVTLADLGQPNSAGVSPASLYVYYNGQLTNQTSVYPGNLIQYNVSGHILDVKVNQTFAGLYAYSKWARLQLYSNVLNITNGKVFNQTTNPNWFVNLEWTNTTSSASANAQALQSIVLYGTASQSATLTPGQSFSFITNPAVYKLQFVGDTLGSSSFDSVTAQTQFAGSVEYQNLAPASAVAGLSVSNLTEPAQELVVSSQIPNAFSYGGQTSSAVTYVLNPFGLVENANTLGAANTANIPVTTNVVLTLTNANLVSSTYPLVVTLTGYPSNTASSPTSTSVTFTATGSQSTTSTFYNITGVKLQNSLPGQFTVQVVESNGANQISLATLANVPLVASTWSGSGPQVLYQQPGVSYQSLTSGSTVIYNQQNGQPTTNFVLTPTWNAIAPAGKGTNQYFYYSASEQPVPGNTAATDSLAFGIVNSTGGVGVTPIFQLNYSAVTTGNLVSVGTKNNVTYTSTQNSVINAQAGFRTEKGSKVASITPTSITLSMAKAVDMLQFAVAPQASNVSKSGWKLYGPYGVGQATNLPNVSIGGVTANISVSSGSYVVSGINNITATPSVSSATQPVLLNNLPTTPLVVLDSSANPSSNLILVGSGYVNSLSQQLQNTYNVSVTPAAGALVNAYGSNRILVAGYYANQTSAAANSFIQQLYANAAST